MYVCIFLILDYLSLQFEAIVKNGGLSYIDPTNDKTIGDDCCHVLDDFYDSPDFPSHKVSNGANWK